MAVPTLSICTDKQTYTSLENVIVTATAKGWEMDPLVKVRLVIWVYQTNDVIDNQYFAKPKNTDTVTWTVPSTVFGDMKKTYDAQLEFAALPAANAQFTH